MRELVGPAGPILDRLAEAGGGFIPDGGDPDGPPDPVDDPNPPPPPPPVIDPAVVRNEKIALIYADLKLQAQALMDRRNMDNPDDVSVYRRAVLSNARASELTKLGVDVYPQVAAILAECEYDVLKLRDNHSKARVVNPKVRRDYKMFLDGLLLVREQQARVQGLPPMAKVMAREALCKMSVKSATFRGRVLRVLGAAIVILARTTMEETIRSKWLQICPEWMSTWPFNLVGRLGRWFGLFSIVLPSLLLSVVEIIRTGGPAKELWYRILMHYILGYLNLRLGWFTAILAHAAHNAAAFRFGGVMLDVFQGKKDIVVNDLCTEHCKMKVVNVQPGFVVTAKPEARCIPRFGARCMWGIAGLYADVMRTCHHNEVTSLRARVGKKLPQHEDGAAAIVEAEWVKLDGVVHKTITGLIRKVRYPLTFEEWVKTFPPAKRAMYSKLVDENAVPPKNPVASSFVKKELVLREEEHCEQVKDPRMIQGCPPELSLFTGPYIRRAAKALKSGLKPKKWLPSSVRCGKQIVYTCGMTAEGVGAAFSKALVLIESMCDAGERVIVIEDDQSRFDLHITGPAFSYLDGLNRDLLPKHVARLLRRTASSKGRTALGCKYKIPYTMQSGWPDTSYADSICNASMKMYIHGIGRKWISIICGDDSVTVTTDSELQLLGGESGIVKSYAKLGMEVDVVIRDDPHLAEFCSARFYNVGSQFVLMPKPGKLMARFGWDMQNRKPSNRLAWARGVVQTMSYYGRVDPLLAALSSSLNRQLGRGEVISNDVSEYSHRVEGRRSAPRPEYLYYYAIHYGLSAGDVDRAVLLLENDAIKLGELCDHPLLKAIAARDL